MKNIIIHVAGIIATFLSIIFLFPTAIKIYKTNSTKSLALTSHIMFQVSAILWFIYAIGIKSYELMLTCFVQFLVGNYIIYKIIKNNNDPSGYNDREIKSAKESKKLRWL